MCNVIISTYQWFCAMRLWKPYVFLLTLASSIWTSLLLPCVHIFWADIPLLKGDCVYWLKFSKPLVVQYGVTLICLFYQSSRHPLRHDKRTHINYNAMCFINNTAQPLGDCDGWRMAMWCLIIQGTWEIKSVESTQHPPLSPLPVTTSSDLSYFLFFPLTWQLLKVYL